MHSFVFLRKILLVINILANCKEYQIVLNSIKNLEKKEIGARLHFY